jgi:hypothetical protein
LTIQEQFEHLEKEAALRQANENGGEDPQADPGLLQRLRAQRAEARQAAMRFDALNEMIHLLERNPHVARILELGRKLDEL